MTFGSTLARTAALCCAISAINLASVRPAAAQVASPDTARTEPDTRVPPVPAPGEKIRVFAPSLPEMDARLAGAFLGVDSAAGVRTLGVSAHDGVHYIPCSSVEQVEVQHLRHFPLWQKVAWVIGGAYVGLYLGHMVADNPPGTFTAEDPPLPHPEREHAAHRRENRMMIGGTVLGATAAYLAVRDMHRWREASLGDCRKPQ